MRVELIRYSVSIGAGNRCPNRVVQIHDLQVCTKWLFPTTSFSSPVGPAYYNESSKDLLQLMTTAFHDDCLSRPITRAAMGLHARGRWRRTGCTVHDFARPGASYSSRVFVGSIAGAIY